MEDTQIIDLFFERSEQALRELDDKYGKAVRRTASNLLKLAQDAEECVNDAYLAVWNSVPPQKPENICAYACGVGLYVLYLNGQRVDDSYRGIVLQGGKKYMQR